MKILGIDLGKYKYAACLFDSDSHETLHFTFPSFPNEFKTLLANTQPELVVIEACALTGWAHDLYQAEAFKILVANTNQNAWCWKHVKRKTDKDDALKLTKLAALGMIVPVHIPPAQSRQYRQWVKYRKRLVRSLVRSKPLLPLRASSGSDVGHCCVSKKSGILI